MNKQLSTLQVSSIVAIALGVIVYLVDPANLWSFDFDDDDMREVVEGRWTLTVKDRTYQLEIRQAGAARTSGRGWLRSADACRSRSFTRTADACSTSSRMELEITVVDDRSLRAEGELFVAGTSFQEANLSLVIGDDANSVSVTARLARTGEVRGVDSSGLPARLERTVPNKTVSPLFPDAGALSATSHGGSAAPPA